MADDIVTQLNRVEKKDDLSFIVLPWSYTIKEFESDSEKLTNIMTEEKAKDMDARFEAFERKIESKHSELFRSIQTLIQNSALGQSLPAKSPPTFAGVVRGGGLQGDGTGSAEQHSMGVGGHRHNSVGRGQHGSAPKSRERSPSVKRPRVEPGNQGGNHGVRAASKQKSVVGTSDSKVTGRKMRSPPADIFVWGVHPETSIEDIIDDLAGSSIIVKESDVIKKSKEEAYLCSYKISVPAADLSKALDPSIWPPRVKVREFIHYARKRQVGGQPQVSQDQVRAPLTQGGQPQADAGAVHGVGHGPHLQVPGIRVENLFGALAGLEAAKL